VSTKPGAGQTVIPGRAEPIVELYLSLNSDSPKWAMLSALAKSNLNETEMAAYNKLISLYKASYKLRNPYAHWHLGYDNGIPNAIIALHPKVFRSYLARLEDGLSKKSKLENTFGEAIQLLENEAQVYRESDITSDRDFIEKTRKLFLEFKFILNWKINDAHPEKRRQLLLTLFQNLELPEPKEE